MLTVKELKILIANVPDDAIVLVEGCDCIRGAIGVEVSIDVDQSWRSKEYASRDEVLITSDSSW